MKRKPISLILLIAACMMILGGCGQSKSVSSSDPTNGNAIKIGLSAWPSWFLWYVAKEKGFFAKNGVNVELVWFPVYSDSLSAFESKKVDMNSFALSDVIAPLEKGFKSQVVLINDNSFGADGLVAKPGINSLKDLKGKRIVTEMGTVDHFFMLQALKKAGLTENDVKFTNMAIADAGSAFISGQADAAVIWEPFLSKAINEGKGNLLYSSKQTPGLIADVLMGSEDVIKNKPDQVKKILNAWYDAVDYYQKNPDESKAIMAKVAEISADELGLEGVKIFSIEDNIKAFQAGSTNVSLAQTAKENGEFLKTVDMIKTIPDTSHLINSTFIEEIQKEKK